MGLIGIGAFRVRSVAAGVSTIYVCWLGRHGERTACLLSCLERVDGLAVDVDGVVAVAVLAKGLPEVEGLVLVHQVLQGQLSSFVFVAAVSVVCGGFHRQTKQTAPPTSISSFGMGRPAGQLTGCQSPRTQPSEMRETVRAPLVTAVIYATTSPISSGSLMNASPVVDDDREAVGPCLGQSSPRTLAPPRHMHTPARRESQT